MMLAQDKHICSSIGGNVQVFFLIDQKSALIHVFTEKK